MSPVPVTVQSRGRPRTDDPGSSVTTWIPQTAHDELTRRAAANGVTVSAYVRMLIAQALGSRGSKWT